MLKLRAWLKQNKYSIQSLLYACLETVFWVMLFLALFVWLLLSLIILK